MTGVWQDHSQAHESTLHLDVEVTDEMVDAALKAPGVNGASRNGRYGIKVCRGLAFTAGAVKSNVAAALGVTVKDPE